NRSLNGINPIRHTDIASDDYFKTSQTFYFFADSVHWNTADSGCLLINYTICICQSMDFIRMRKVLDLCILKRCHHIPGILVAFKIGMVCTDPRKSKKAQHESKTQ